MTSLLPPNYHQLSVDQKARAINRAREDELRRFARAHGIKTATDEQVKELRKVEDSINNPQI